MDDESETYRMWKVRKTIMQVINQFKTNEVEHAEISNPFFC